jgi:phenylpropionate dioxygenase-like ring-hydroxylating dioxygenase large terminal subunit
MRGEQLAGEISPPAAEAEENAALPLYRAPPLREAWYFAVSGGRLRRGAATGATILGERLLIGRDAAGAPFALRDLCPHRGMPLSCGRFDGREIECAYHGWRFTTEGACAAIPALATDQPFPASQIRIKRYPVREVEGNIWVYIGEDPAGAPDIPVAAPDAPAPLSGLVETIRFRGDINNAALSLIDPAHGPFVHESRLWHKRGTARDKAKSYVPSPFGFTMVPHATSANYRAYKILGGRPETEIVFQLPATRIERTRVGRHLICNMTAMTPLAEGEIQMNHVITWTMPWLTALGPLLRPFVRRFIGQDKRAMERQRIGLADNPPMLFVGDADAPIRWYFRLRNEYEAARREGRPFANPLKPRTLRWRT